jgi:prevent-host-death family protein
MAKIFNVHEAKTHLSRLLEEARAGKEIIIAKAGEPYVKLVPVDKPAPRPLGFLAGKAILSKAFFEPLPEDELAAWEGAYSSSEDKF